MTNYEFIIATVGSPGPGPDPEPTVRLSEYWPGVAVVGMGSALCRLPCSGSTATAQVLDAGEDGLRSGLTDRLALDRLAPGTDSTPEADTACR